MRNVLMVVMLVSLTSCIFLSPPTKLGLLKHHESITSSYFAEDVPYSWKIKKDFLKGKIVVLGLCKLAIIDKENTNKRQVISYEIRSFNPDLLQINGKMHIVAGGDGFSDVGLMDEEGKLIWKYRPDPDDLAPYDMVAGDLNNDGSPEFYAGTYDGLHILDKDGKITKKVDLPGQIYGVEICTYNNKPSIICRSSFQSEYKLRFWDFNGNLLKTVDNKKEVSELSIVNWPGGEHILADNGSKIYILDLNGNIILKKNIGVKIYGLSGTAVYFQENKKPYLAVVVKYRSRYRRSSLYIFSPEGELIYQEVLYTTTAITAIKDQETNREYLLVGGGSSPDGRIIIKKYEMK